MKVGLVYAYDYDLNGNRISQTAVTGKTTGFSYNDLDLLTEVCENGNKIAGYEYNPDGTIQVLHNDSALTAGYAYNADKNLMGLEVLQNGDKHDNYDGFNRTTKVETADGQCR